MIIPIQIDILFFLIAFLGGLGVGLVGIGTSLVVIPALIIIFPTVFPNSIALKMAVATSVTSTILACGVATLSYIVCGWSNPVKFTLGYIYIPTFLFISLGIILSVPIGIKLAEKIHVKWLSYVLMLFVFSSGLFTLVNAFY